MCFSEQGEEGAARGLLRGHQKLLLGLRQEPGEGPGLREFEILRSFESDENTLPGWDNCVSSQLDSAKS